MKSIAFRFLCFMCIAARCFASPDDDVYAWLERAGKTRAGMPLAEAEALFPPDTSVGPSRFYGPTTITSGPHEICVYWVSPSIFVTINYQRTGPENPLNGPVAVERWSALYSLSVDEFSPVSDVFSAAPLTLRSTITRDVRAVFTSL